MERLRSEDYQAFRKDLGQEIEHSERNLDDFCDATDVGQGCWPSSFLLGVLRGGSSALALALDRSGLAQLGVVNASDNTTLSPPEWNLASGSGGKVLEPQAFGIAFRDSADPTTCGVPSYSFAAASYTRLFRRPKMSVSERMGVDASRTPSFLDASPSYFESAEAPVMLDRMMPAPLLAQARFVVVLREPIARAISWFNYLRAWAALNDVVDSEIGPDGGPVHWRALESRARHSPSVCFRMLQNALHVRNGNVSFAQVTFITR